MESFKKPDCSEWKIWEGPEIEGSTDRGVMTLFVREGDPSNYFALYDRVWFTKEYTDWQTVMSAYLIWGKKVCIEATIDTLESIPMNVRENCQIYLKLDVYLKPSDHVCVGTPFKDQAFMIGDGVKVLPEDYSSDRRLE